MLSKTVALIDIDSLYYMCSKETAEESIAEFDRKFLGILEHLKVDFYAAFNSKSYYFRHKINPDYKGQRVYNENMKWVNFLKSYSEVKYNVQNMKFVEADDLVAYWASNHPQMYAEQEGESIKTYELKCLVVSADKDVIMLPHKSFNFKSWTMQNTPERISHEFFVFQMLCGDSTDNILGCAERLPHVYKSGEKEGQEYLKRVGITPKQAEAFIAGYAKAKKELLLPRVLEYYIEMFGESKGISKYSENYRLLKMMSTDEEFIREGFTVPSDLPLNDAKSLINNNIF